MKKYPEIEMSKLLRAHDAGWTHLLSYNDEHGRPILEFLIVTPGGGPARLHRLEQKHPAVLFHLYPIPDLLGLEECENRA